jgi:hypothetical protein
MMPEWSKTCIFILFYDFYAMLRQCAMLHNLDVPSSKKQQQQQPQEHQIWLGTKCQHTDLLNKIGENRLPNDAAVVTNMHFGPYAFYAMLRQCAMLHNHRSTKYC